MEQIRLNNPMVSPEEVNAVEVSPEAVFSESRIGQLISTEAIIQLLDKNPGVFNQVDNAPGLLSIGIEGVTYIVPNPEYLRKLATQLRATSDRAKLWKSLKQKALSTVSKRYIDGNSKIFPNWSELVEYTSTRYSDNVGSGLPVVIPIIIEGDSSEINNISHDEYKSIDLSALILERLLLDKKESNPTLRMVNLKKYCETVKDLKEKKIVLSLPQFRKELLEACSYFLNPPAGYESPKHYDLVRILDVLYSVSSIDPTYFQEEWSSSLFSELELKVNNLYSPIINEALTEGYKNSLVKEYNATTLKLQEVFQREFKTFDDKVSDAKPTEPENENDDKLLTENQDMNPNTPTNPQIVPELINTVLGVNENSNHANPESSLEIPPAVKVVIDHYEQITKKSYNSLTGEDISSLNKIFAFFASNDGYKQYMPDNAQKVLKFVQEKNSEKPHAKDPYATVSYFYNLTRAKKFGFKLPENFEQTVKSKYQEVIDNGGENAEMLALLKSVTKELGVDVESVDSGDISEVPSLVVEFDTPITTESLPQSPEDKKIEKLCDVLVEIKDALFVIVGNPNEPKNYLEQKTIDNILNGDSRDFLQNFPRFEENAILTYLKKPELAERVRQALLDMLLEYHSDSDMPQSSHKYIELLALAKQESSSKFKFELPDDYLKLAQQKVEIVRASGLDDIAKTQVEGYYAVIVGTENSNEHQIQNNQPETVVVEEPVNEQKSFASLDSLKRLSESLRTDAIIEAVAETYHQQISEMIAEYRDGITDENAAERQKSYIARAKNLRSLVREEMGIPLLDLNAPQEIQDATRAAWKALSNCFEAAVSKVESSVDEESAETVVINQGENFVGNPDVVVAEKEETETKVAEEIPGAKDNSQQSPVVPEAVVVDEQPLFVVTENNTSETAKSEDQKLEKSLKAVANVPSIEVFLSYKDRKLGEVYNFIEDLRTIRKYKFDDLQKNPIYLLGQEVKSGKMKTQIIGAAMNAAYEYINKKVKESSAFINTIKGPLKEYLEGTNSKNIDREYLHNLRNHIGVVNRYKFNDLNKKSINLFGVPVTSNEQKNQILNESIDIVVNNMISRNILIVDKNSGKVNTRVN